MADKKELFELLQAPSGDWYVIAKFRDAMDQLWVGGPYPTPELATDAGINKFGEEE